MAIISLTLFLTIGILALGALLHQLYLDIIYKKLLYLSGEPQQSGISFKASISKEDLLKEIYIAQGYNFNALAISEWSLFFIALAYFYFLTPSFFPEYNYFKLAPLASGLIGFFIFGLIILLLTLPFSIGFSRVYGFYEISLRMKKIIIAPFGLLIVSIICSAYIGTIYPSQITLLPAAIDFVTILISQIILLAPIYIGTTKVMR